MRAHAKLTAGKLKAAKDGALKPGRIGDGGGLWLSIGPNGTASWLFRYALDGKARHIGFGSVRDVPASTARERAAEARALLAAGKDPSAEKARAIEARRAAERRKRTFGDAVEEFLAGKSPSKNEAHNRQWEYTLRHYALPTLGSISIADMTRADVLKVVEPLWRTKNETARRLRGRIERVVDAELARGNREKENPARLGPLVAVLGRARPQVIHHASMPWQDVPDFVASLRKDTTITARALEYLIMTAGRSNEVIGATWPEIDEDEKLWSLSAARMKASRPHRVPLSDPALAILDDVRPFRDDDAPIVFRGGAETGGLSNMAMAMLLRRADLEVTPHGFRSSFRSWARDSARADHDVAEMCLAHAVGGAVVNAYQRSDLFHQRRDLMQRWADFVWR